MKITDLFESTSLSNFERIINSPYFKDNVVPYITDSKPLDEVIGDLKYGTFLYHGSQNSYPEDPVKFAYRGAPKDTVFYSHTLVNRLSEEKFGEPVRQLLFAMNNPQNIRKYAGDNEHRVLFPLGQYRLFYHPKVVDFTIELQSASTKTDATDYMKAATSMFRAGIESIPEFDFNNRDVKNDHFKKNYFFKGFQPVMREIAEMLYEQGIVLSKEDIKAKFEAKLVKALDVEVPQEDFDYMFQAMYSTYVDHKQRMDKRLQSYVDQLKEISGDIMSKNIGNSEVMVKCDAFLFVRPDDIPDLIEYYLKKNSSLGLFGDDEETQ